MGLLMFHPTDKIEIAILEHEKSLHRAARPRNHDMQQ